MPENNQNTKGSLAFLSAGLFEVFFILITLAVIFGVLNYFNILSLSTLYPKQFGFLPHQQVLNQNKNATTNLTNSQITNPYTEKVKKLDKPAYNTDLKQTIGTGFFTGVSGNKLEVETAIGKLSFTIEADTLLQKMTTQPVNTTTNGTVVEPSKTYSLTDFAKEIPAGSYLQIFYNDTTNLKAITVDYIPNYR